MKKYRIEKDDSTGGMEKICLPKKYGGLNVKSSTNWNVASIGNLLWQLIERKESLWVKRVHDLYMKSDTNIWTHKVPFDCSWYWKKLNSLKNEMQTWYVQGHYTLSNGVEYSITVSYNALLGDLNRVQTADLIWSIIAQPNVCADLKMYVHVENVYWCLCEAQDVETNKHLFV